MKRIIKINIILTLLLTISSITYARDKWSTGLRTGIALRHVNMSIHTDFKPYNQKWQNQIFLARTVGKRFELEISLSYSQKTSKGNYRNFITGDITYFDDKETAINPGFTVRYYAIQYKNLSFFTQLGIEYIDPIIRQTSIYYLPNRAPQVYTFKYETWLGPSALFAGMGSNYTLSKKLYVSGQINLKFKSGFTELRGQDEAADLAANTLVGIGYRF